MNVAGYLTALRWGRWLAALPAFMVLALPGPAEALYRFHSSSLQLRGVSDTLTIGDINGNGREDLAVPHPRRGEVELLIQRRSGGFARRSIDVGRNPESASIGDLDGQGRPDLAVAYLGGRALSLLYQADDGAFRRQDLTVPVRSKWVKVADFNGDGRQDVAAAAGEGVGKVTLFLQLPEGTFSRDVFDVGGGVSALATGDVNGDAVPDLAAAVYYEDPPTSGFETTHVSLFEHDPGGGFDRTDLPVAEGVTSVAIDDVDGDGREDLAVASVLSHSEPVAVLYQNPSGDFSRTKITGAGGHQIAIADVDQDDTLDLVLNNPYALQFLVQGADGSFAIARLVTPRRGAADHGLVVGDLNGDGLADLVTAHRHLTTLLQTRRPVPDCRGREPEVVGTNADDVIGTDPEEPTVAGLGGRDLIVAGGHNFAACGNAGDDSFSVEGGDSRRVRFLGGRGGDTVTVAVDHDQLDQPITVSGGPGADVLLGGALADLLAGGAGRDRVLAGPGPDRAAGGAGADNIGGGDGDDSLRGNSGNDRLRGRGGKDSADGGAGRDDCAAEIKRDCER